MCSVYYEVAIYLLSLKNEWVMLIGWCPPLCPELSSMPLDAKRLRALAIYIQHLCVGYMTPCRKDKLDSKSAVKGKLLCMFA
jgi:hypothetical protein